MKKVILATLAAGTAMVAMPAHAEVGNPNNGTVNLTLEANVSELCGAYKYDEPLTYDFGDLAATPTSSTLNSPEYRINILCNDPAGGTISISSTNGGYLVRAGGSASNAADRIAYQVEGDSSYNPYDFARTSLTAPVTISFSGNEGLQGQNMDMQAFVNGVLLANDPLKSEGDHTTVFAGDYSDVVVVTVTGAA